MKPTVLTRVAMRLASWNGDDGRTSELHGHLADAAVNGQPIRVRDVGSLCILVGRRAVRDIPWWIAGLPVPAILLMILAITYETQFRAWDLVGASEHPRTPETEAWMLAVTVIGIVGVVAALVAGRISVRELRRGSVLAPVALVAALLIGSSQTDLYTQELAWVRDGGLKAEHVNDVSLYGVAVFGAIAAIPLVYLLVLWARDRIRQPGTRRPKSVEVESHAEFDPVALAAVGLPVLTIIGGWPRLLLVLSLVFTWSAQSFSTRLKVAATVAVLVPIAAAVIWTIVLSLELDDGHPVVIFGVLGLLIAVWLRMAVVAFRPLRKLRVQIAVEHKP